LKYLASLLCGLVRLGGQTAEECSTTARTRKRDDFGMGYDLKMYSPLKQINKVHIKRLCQSGISAFP